MTLDLTNALEVAEELKNLKVNFTLTAKQPNRIRSLQLPFSERQWLHLCVQEGIYYLGGCCGLNSTIQDKLNHIFRYTGWAEGHLFREICEAMEAHGDPGFDKTYKAITYKTFRGWDPFKKVTHLWLLTKAVLEEDHLASETEEDGYPPIEWAVRSATRALRVFDTHFLLSGLFDKEVSLTEKAVLTQSAARLLPHLKTILNQFQELAPAPFEGFGIVDSAGAVVTGSTGPCIYQSEEDARIVLAAFLEHVPQSVYQIRRVHVSLESGITVQAV